MEWDDYFKSICDAVASKSNCLSRKIGAVLVKDRVVVSTGYNGPPRNYPHCGPSICPRRAAGFRSGEGLHMCPAVHAERNALAQAARLGIPVKGATLYLNTQIPCKDCLAELVNAGVVEIVCTELKPYDKISEEILKYSGVLVRLFK